MQAPGPNAFLIHLLVTCRPSGCAMASGVVRVFVVVIVVGVCNRSPMRTMFDFWCEYRS